MTPLWVVTHIFCRSSALWKCVDICMWHSLALTEVSSLTGDSCSSDTSPSYIGMNFLHNHIVYSGSKARDHKLPFLMSASSVALSFQLSFPLCFDRRVLDLSCYPLSWVTFLSSASCLCVPFQLWGQRQTLCSLSCQTDFSLCFQRLPVIPSL